MRYAIDRFKGIRPMVAPDLLGGNDAQIADNVKITSGQIEAWYNELQEEVLESEGTVRTIYLYDDQYWLEWEAAVDIVKAPISGDTEGKLYYTGDGIPKKTNDTEATTGAGAMPINFFPLAVPAAKLAATAALGGGGSGDPRAINYTWTVVTDWSEEGLPSPASNTVSAMSGQTVNLSGMTLVWQASTAYNQGDFVFPVGDEDGTYLYKCVVPGTSGAAQPGTWGTTIDGDTTDGSVTWRCFTNNLQEKRIYRINTGLSYAQYELVDTIAIGTTVYADSKLDTQLANVLPSQYWDYPPDELSGLTYMSNGIVVGFVGKDLYFSEPYRPWAYPIDYRLSVSSPIVSIISLGSTIIVTTEENPYSVTGIDPNSMTPLKMPDPIASVAARSSVGYTTGGIYAAPNGLYLVDGVKGLLLTKDHYTVDEWSALHPETMHSYIHDHKVFIFYSKGGDEGGLVFNLISGQVTPLDFYTECAYVDPKTDILYFRKSSSEARLFEDGTIWPARTGARLLEDGNFRLLE